MPQTTPAVRHPMNHAIGGRCAMGRCTKPPRADGLAHYEPSVPTPWSMFAKPEQAVPTKALRNTTPATFVDHAKVPWNGFDDEWKVRTYPHAGAEGRTTWKPLYDAADMMAVISTVPAGKEYPAHWHAHPEIYFSVDGGTKTRTGDDVFTRFEPGDAATIPSMGLHHTINDSDHDATIFAFVTDFRYRMGPETIGLEDSRYHTADDYTTPRDLRPEMQPVVLKPGSGATVEFQVPGSKTPFRFETLQDDAELSFGRGQLPAGATLPTHVRGAQTYVLPISGCATATSEGRTGALSKDASAYVPAGSRFSITAGPDAPLDFVLFSAKCGERAAGQAVWAKPNTVRRT